MNELPFGTQVKGKSEGVFVAITARSDIYRDYEDEKMSAEYRAAKYPLVLMMNRWDGKIGFVGGFREGDESLEDCARHELAEEAGIVDLPPARLRGLCTHEAEKIVVHLFHVDLGDLSKDALRAFLHAAVKAPHAIAEGSAFWAHLGDYGRGKGLHTLLGASTLALAVKEELEAVLGELGLGPAQR